MIHYGMTKTAQLAISRGLAESCGGTGAPCPRDNGVLWPALDLGCSCARIKAADARTEASLAFYERTVLTALEETEGALVDFEQDQSRQQFLTGKAGTGK